MIRGGEPLESFWDYREHFRAELRRSLALEAGEGRPEYGEAARATPLNERLIQAIWAHQMLQPEGMKLADGRPLRVVDPGQWQGSAGPDFRGAQIMIGEDLATGDVEIHLDASEWRRHRHEADLDYNRCVLHAVYRIDDGRASDALHNGGELPRLEMEPYLFPDLESIRRSLTPDDFPYDQPSGLGRCHELMMSMDPAVVAEFLDRAGDERLAAKIARLEEQARSAGGEQVLYQALMMSLGAGAGKALYYLLAKRCPAAELLDYAGELPEPERRAGIESILFHVAGLMPDEAALAEAPAESAEHARRLGQLWARFEPYWRDRAIAPTRRWRRGIRPVNFPERRLGAVACMLARAGRAGALAEDLRARILAAGEALAGARPSKKMPPALRDLARRFEIEEPASFWTGHYSFAAKPASSPMALIGASTARSLVLNAAIPAAAWRGRAEGDAKLEEAARRIYALFPPLEANHVTQFMERRLFGDSARAKDLIRTERRQQGLFQIFYSCCNGDERTCDKCYFLAER